MSVGVLLVTHNGLGPDLLNCASRVLPIMPLKVDCLEVPWDGTSPELLALNLRSLLRDLDEGQGVLILVDLYGSTPSNVAHLVEPGRLVERVYGVNLPMLLRVLNYPQLSLSELAAVAIEGGRTGVMAEDG